MFMPRRILTYKGIKREKERGKKVFYIYTDMYAWRKEVFWMREKRISFLHKVESLKREKKRKKK